MDRRRKVSHRYDRYAAIHDGTSRPYTSFGSSSSDDGRRCMSRLFFCVQNACRDRVNGNGNGGLLQLDLDGTMGQNRP